MVWNEFNYQNPRNPQNPILCSISIVGRTNDFCGDSIQFIRSLYELFCSVICVEYYHSCCMQQAVVVTMSRSSLKHSTCRFGIMINAERDGEHKGCNYGSIERELGWNDCAYCQNYVERMKR